MVLKSLIKLFFSLALLGVWFQTKSQPYKTEKDFKAYLLRNNKKLDFIEGIWEFNTKIKSGLTDTKNKDFNKQFPPFNIDVFLKASLN